MSGVTLSATFGHAAHHADTCPALSGTRVSCATSPRRTVVRDTSGRVSGTLWDTAGFSPRRGETRCPVVLSAGCHTEATA